MQSTQVPIWDRPQLLAGNVLDGPAVIVQDTSTTILQDGDRATIDAFGNIRIVPGGSQS
jgi:N-methylhydantoinase A